MISVGAVQLRARGEIRQRRKGSGDHALRGRGAVLDDGGRQVGALAVLDQLRAQNRQAQEAHVDDDRLPRPGERRPVEVHAAVLEVAR